MCTTRFHISPPPPFSCVMCALFAAHSPRARAQDAIANLLGASVLRPARKRRQHLLCLRGASHEERPWARACPQLLRHSLLRHISSRQRQDSLGPARRPACGTRCGAAVRAAGLRARSRHVCRVTRLAIGLNRGVGIKGLNARASVPWDPSITRIAKIVARRLHGRLFTFATNISLPNYNCNITFNNGARHIGFLCLGGVWLHVIVLADEGTLQL